MRLLLDQELPLSAAALLRDAGINTVHIGESGMAEDGEIIQRARAKERVVATYIVSHSQPNSQLCFG